MRQEEFVYWVTTEKAVPEAVAAVQAFSPHSDPGGVPEGVEAIVRSIVDEAAVSDR